MSQTNFFANRFIKIESDYRVILRVKIIVPNSRRDLFKARCTRLSRIRLRHKSPRRFAKQESSSIQTREIKKFPLAERRRRRLGTGFPVQLGRCVYPIVVFIVHYAFRSREENLFEKCSGNWKNLFGGSFSPPLSAKRGRCRGSRRLLGNRCARRHRGNFLIWNFRKPARAHGDDVNFQEDQYHDATRYPGTTIPNNRVTRVMLV